jgi:hypothetical protein
MVASTPIPPIEDEDPFQKKGGGGGGFKKRFGFGPFVAPN